MSKRKDMLEALASSMNREAVPELIAWQPIETAPQNDTPVDIWRAGGERCTNMSRVELSPDNVFYSPNYAGPSCVRDATHWMPIPEPPK